MNYSKQIRSFASDLVSHYAVYDAMSKYYTIHFSDIPDFDIHQLASMIMASDEAYASEATGADNPAYEKKMLPALLNYLKNTTDRDNEIEFNNAWRDGVTSYFLRAIQELLDEECIDHLHSEMHEHGFTSYQDRNNGEIHWRKYA